MELKILIIPVAMFLAWLSHSLIVLRRYPEPWGYKKLGWREGMLITEFVGWLSIAVFVYEYGERNGWGLVSTYILLPAVSFLLTLSVVRAVISWCEKKGWGVSDPHLFWAIAGSLIGFIVIFVLIYWMTFNAGPEIVNLFKSAMNSLADFFLYQETPHGRCVDVLHIASGVRG